MSPLLVGGELRQRLPLREMAEGGGGDGRVVAETSQPDDIWFFAKPRELAFGEAARGLLDLRNGLREREAPFEVRAQFGVADELERLRIGRYGAGDQLTDLVEPACREHGFDASVDARVEIVARRQEADFSYRVAFERCAAAAMNFSHRLSGKDAHLDGANDFLGVAWSDALGRFAVEAREDAV